MIEIINDIAKKYGFFVVGGAIGAVIHRLRKKMSWRRFAASVVISGFVALCVGVICLHSFKLEAPVVHVLCGISGVFSEVILDEAEESIKLASEWVRQKMQIKDKSHDGQ